MDRSLPPDKWLNSSVPNPVPGKLTRSSTNFPSSYITYSPQSLPTSTTQRHPRPNHFSAFNVLTIHPILPLRSKLDVLLDGLFQTPKKQLRSRHHIRVHFLVKSQLNHQHFRILLMPFHHHLV